MMAKKNQLLVTGSKLILWALVCSLNQQDKLLSLQICPEVEKRKSVT